MIDLARAGADLVRIITTAQEPLYYRPTVEAYTDEVIAAVKDWIVDRIGRSEDLHKSVNQDVLIPWIAAVVLDFRRDYVNQVRRIGGFE